MTIPLGGSVGKILHDDRASFVIEAVHPPTDSLPATIEMTARPIVVQGDPTAKTNPIPSRPEISSRQIEILGEDGSILSWFQTKASYDGEVARYTISIESPGRLVPASLRFHEIGRSSVEVPFEFRDIAMP